MSVLFNQPWQQVFDSSGNTLPGARLYFYYAGTSTPAVVYADVGLGTPLPNPVVANAGGRFQPIYLNDGMYKAVLKTSDDVLVWTADNIQTTSEDADVAVALEAIMQTSISAGYTEEEARNPTNFVKSVYKYASRSNWYVEDETSAADAYILNGLDDYTRLNDYFLGQPVWFVTINANETADATVNVANLGTKRIYRADSSPIEPGDIYGCVHLVYNGSSFILQTPATVNEHGDQTIYGIKTFDESPIVPTLEAGDESEKPVNSEYLKSVVNSMFKPDYENAVTITEGHYTPDVNGIIYLVSRAGNNRTAIYVNGVLAIWSQGHSGSSHGQPIPPMTVLVGAGDLVQISGSTSEISEITTYQMCKFVPYGNYPKPVEEQQEE